MRKPNKRSILEARLVALPLVEIRGAADLFMGYATRSTRFRTSLVITRIVLRPGMA